MLDESRMKRLISLLHKKMLRQFRYTKFGRTTNFLQIYILKLNPSVTFRFQTKPSLIIRPTSGVGRSRAAARGATSQNWVERWSFIKMFIECVRSGRTGKYLALGHNARTSRRSVSSP